jgi:hypothetical protein
MIKCTRSASIRVTGQAGITVVTISTYSLVLGIHFTLIMAGETAKYCKIAGISMAIAALIPFAIVFSAVYREILSVMIEG